MISEFEAPIPGESLTTPPGSRPWERPPEISDPEEAIQMHLSRLSNKEMMMDIADGLELGLDVVTLTEGILRSAVAEGIHSLDVSLIAAPVVHEFIKSVGDAAGIEYEEGLVDTEAEEKKSKSIEYAKAKKMARKLLSTEDKDFLSDYQPDGQTTLGPSDEPAAEEPPMGMPEEEGFMKRRPT